MKNLTVADHLRKLALRMLSDSRGHMAELEATVAGALEEMDAAKQDKITGQPGQAAGFDKDGNLAAQSAGDVVVGAGHRVLFEFDGAYSFDDAETDVTESVYEGENGGRAFDEDGVGEFNAGDVSDGVDETAAEGELIHEGVSNDEGFECVRGGEASIYVASESPEAGEKEINIEAHYFCFSGGAAFNGTSTLLGNRLKDVAAPVSDADAANKGYVDSLVGDIGLILDSIIGKEV